MNWPDELIETKNGDIHIFRRKALREDVALYTHRRTGYVYYISQNDLDTGIYSINHGTSIAQPGDSGLTWQEFDEIYKCGAIGNTNAQPCASGSFKVGDWVEVKKRYSNWFQAGDRFQITEAEISRVRGISPSYPTNHPLWILNDMIFHIHQPKPPMSQSGATGDSGGWGARYIPTGTVMVDKEKLTATGIVNTIKDEHKEKIGQTDFDKALHDLEKWAGVDKTKPCECGADTIKHPFHYDWCPKYEDVSGSA